MSFDFCIHFLTDIRQIYFGRSCLLRGAVGVLRATLSLRCGSHHATHALRMPNAKEVFFVGFGFTHPPAPKVKGLKTLLFTCATYVYARVSA